MSERLEDLIGNAILGIDTLWGGDVMCASGTGRFIADSWFSDEPLPRAYTVAEAAPVRASAAFPPSRPTWRRLTAISPRSIFPARLRD